MASLVGLLPQPRLAYSTLPSSIRDQNDDDDDDGSVSRSSLKAKFEPPPYGKRQKFQPRTVQDFGDGGAFPEIHILQYPLNMGKPGVSSDTSLAPLKVDAQGKIKYDMIIRQNMRTGTNLQSTYQDLMEKEVDDEHLLKRPDQEEQAKIAARTAAALGQIVDKKVTVALPGHFEKESKEVAFIKYTPSNYNPLAGVGAPQRLIRLQEAPIDPLEPPKFKHKKAPTGPPSPPVPVMHSPPRKITVEDQQNWKIPPCISNWKNIKGYTIPLDKRLAADGRGLQQVQINDKFAKLSESLFLAERNSREEIEQRAALLRKIQRKKREETEEELRNLARKAREANTNVTRDQDDYEETQKMNEDKQGSESERSEDEQDIDKIQERDELRKDRARETRRAMRMEAKRSAVVGARNVERDVSEKIALGESVGQSKDSMFDQRLFAQAESAAGGMTGGDDAYNIYDKPLFAGSSANALYRPKAVDLDDDTTDNTRDSSSLLSSSKSQDTSRFKPDRGFAGAGTGADSLAGSASSSSGRSKPVVFEKGKTDEIGEARVSARAGDDIAPSAADIAAAEREQEEDPFGLSRLLDTAKGQGQRKPLDHIGKRGGLMTATGGAAYTSSNRDRDRERDNDKDRDRDSGRHDRDHEKDRDRNRDRDRDRDRDRGRDSRRNSPPRHRNSRSRSRSPVNRSRRDDYHDRRRNYSRSRSRSPTRHDNRSRR